MMPTSGTCKEFAIAQSDRNPAPLPQQAAANARVQPWKAWLGDTVDIGFEKKGIDDALMLKSGVQDNGIAS
jgi:hypothetical protein